MKPVGRAAEARRALTSTIPREETDTSRPISSPALWPMTGTQWTESGIGNQEKVPMNLASYLFTTAASRLSMEPFAADGGLCF